MPHLTASDLDGKKAILFGSIGAVIESSELQRAGFNEAFEEAGLDWHWDRPEYQELIKECGGEKRIREYAEARGEDVDAEALHHRKTAIFNESLRTSNAQLRPEVKALVDMAKERGLKLAFVTTTGQDNVDAMFDVMEERGLKRDDFAAVFSRESVKEGKPSPEVYEMALEKLGISADEAIAVEDSSPSLRSSHGAGVPTLILAGANTKGQDYTGATWIGADL